MKSNEIIIKAVEKCIEINMSAGKAVAFFEYFPHITAFDIRIYKGGWKGASTSADFSLHYYFNGAAYKWVGGSSKEVDLLNELDSLIKEYGGENNERPSEECSA